MRLSKLRIEAARQKGVEHFLWDSAMPGLGVRIMPSGRATYIVQYRAGSGQQRRRKIGLFPIVTVDEARDEAREWLRDAGRHQDPAEKVDRLRQSKDDRFEAVVDQFIEKYAKPRQRRWKETSRTLKVNCAAWLQRPVALITKRDTFELLDGFIAAGHPYKAARTLSWLKTFGRWAAKRDIIEASPFEAVEIDFETAPRTRFYSDDEVRAIWQAADQLPPREAGFVKLIVLLAPRKGELAGMRRSEFDDPRSPTLWTTPFERTKATKRTKKKRFYLTPLPLLAQRIIKGIPRADADDADADDADLVFPGRRSGVPMDPGTWLKAALIENGAPLDFTFHVARHTLTTWLENEGHSHYERGLVLNHAGSAGVTGDYSHGYPLELKRQLLEKWADHVAQLVRPKGAALLR